MAEDLSSGANQAGDDSSASQGSPLREDVLATSAEYESKQDYLQGMRLRLITAAYVISRCSFYLLV